MDDAAPSMVISKKSDDPGLEAMVPCTLKLPEKFVVYTAIVCSALLLLIPGLASMLLEVFASGPPDAVKLDTDVLAVNSGYAPSKSSIEPAAAYPVPE